VLPLRGSLGPTILIEDWIPVVLYATAMIGFVVAGIGILGLKPFDAAISPLLVLSSGLSLVAIVRFADPTLWFGALCDVILLSVGLWRSYGGWPEHPSHGTRWHLAGLAAGVALIAYVAGTSVLYPWHRSWGSTRDEILMSLPGDPSARDFATEIQHGVTIDAPPEEVWPWLVQIGQDRAGFYSYDWLERAIGDDVRNVREIRPEWQVRKVGDLVRAAQPGYLGGLLGDPLGWKVTYLDPPHVMVLENWGTFALTRTPRGQTRLIIRSSITNRHISVWASAINWMSLELPHFIMQRRMMLTIKDLAEEGRVRSAALQ
jgi:hypothetical protein